jgi:hypothetical protein
MELFSRSKLPKFLVHSSQGIHGSSSGRVLVTELSYVYIQDFVRFDQCLVVFTFLLSMLVFIVCVIMCVRTRIIYIYMYMYTYVYTYVNFYVHAYTRSCVCARAAMKSM